jgi:hypothetical protein
MADRFYGVALGGMAPKDVTEGAATGGAAAPIELRISDTVYTSKLGVQQALEAIRGYLATKENNPIS